MPVAHVATLTGQIASGTSIVIAGVGAGANNLYMVSYCCWTDSGSLPAAAISSISGGGLTWSLVPGTVGCSGRLDNNRTEIWRALGSPGGSFSVTITLNKSARASAIISRYTGIDLTTPVAGGNYANTNGPVAPACGGGSDNTTIVINTTPTLADSAVYVLSQPRHRTIDTPDADYTQRGFVNNVDSGDGANLYAHDFIGAPVATDVCQHALSSDAPWIASSCVIRVAPVAIPQPQQMVI